MRRALSRDRLHPPSATVPLVIRDMGFTSLDPVFSAALDGINKRNFCISGEHLPTLCRKGDERPTELTLHNERTSMHKQFHVEASRFVC